MKKEGTARTVYLPRSTKSRLLRDRQGGNDAVAPTDRFEADSMDAGLGLVLDGYAVTRDEKEAI